MTERYLGSGTVARDTSGLTGPVPEHLPERLAITLWDFSWYTRAGEGDVYADLDAACADAATLGYNALRICAAPMLLFGGLGLDDLARDLDIEGLGAAPGGGYYGQRTRWYDTPGGYRIDLLAHLAELFAAARRHGLVLILASWEYQQSPSFARSPRWFEAIDAVPLDERYRSLADAWDRMLTWIDAQGFRDLVALVELHNEVDFSILPALGDGGAHEVVRLRSRHPDLLITASYGKPPHLAMHRVPGGLGAAQFHVYSYGVLDALQQRIDIRSEGSEGFPNAELQALLLTDAPTPAEYGRPAEWKLRATVVTDQMIYGYDWVDVEAWDAWLDAAYPPYAEVMRREIESRVIAIAEWARWQGVPALVGEGWVGYTPLHGSFEEGEIGRGLAEHGIRTALAHGVWGAVPCSNAAPHHPMWQLRDWQRSVNALVRGSR
ncbi:cellulase-like family protein [Microbacterium dauci]|uniref:Cellulase-like family protein n=1 Tax=Microbacterium dauci TaxID=3048008 RepID=A0ABT6ZEY0_9MICO|nr:cellulase-like family protein [Microbacterium sp. LX3-4]MDJ1114270.1 cellulase-like family protein [Microbacterium sp. LX3-4]